MALNAVAALSTQQGFTEELISYSLRQERNNALTGAEVILLVRGL